MKPDARFRWRMKSRSNRGLCWRSIVGVTTLGHVPVNSSHHQSADVVGDGLRVVAHSPTDGVIEAIEGTSPEHFVLGVQWHPERSVDEAGPLGDSARAIFRSFIERARERQQNL
jgi:gamma-glutamyl-gamma-aminobutyrate hydrolase PuuD